MLCKWLYSHMTVTKIIEWLLSALPIHSKRIYACIIYGAIHAYVSSIQYINFYKWDCLLMEYTLQIKHICMKCVSAEWYQENDDNILIILLISLSTDILHAYVFNLKCIPLEGNLICKKSIYCMLLTYACYDYDSKHYYITILINLQFCIQQ